MTKAAWMSSHGGGIIMENGGVVLCDDCPCDRTYLTGSCVLWDELCNMPIPLYIDATLTYIEEWTAVTLPEGTYRCTNSDVFGCGGVPNSCGWTLSVEEELGSLTILNIYVTWDIYLEDFCVSAEVTRHIFPCQHWFYWGNDTQDFPGPLSQCVEDDGGACVIDGVKVYTVENDGGFPVSMNVPTTVMELALVYE